MKREHELALTIPALVFLGPLLLGIATMIWLRHGWPVIFKQDRPGLGGDTFTLYKFRTMTDARDSHGELLPDAKRLTNLGRFLRATSLDELPEFLNIIKGDMSIVGPRPLLMQYLRLYTHEQARRHEVKPGLTGWAQVNGRNALSWDEKFRFDIWYVENKSFQLDLKIILLTIKSVFSREGISHHGEATMHEFMGSANDS